MPRYIDADALTDVFNRLADDPWNANANTTWSKAYDYAVELIEEQQTADVVERKVGKWIWDDEGYHCSECFFHAYGNTLECFDGTYRYCPSCGARMKGEDDG